MFEELEQDGKFVEHIKQNRLDGVRFLQLKTSLYLNPANKQLNLAMGCIVEGFKLFRPEFSIDNIDDYFYSYSELISLNNLASVYKYEAEANQAVEVYKLILHNLDSNFASLSGDYKGRFYIRTLSNISMTYGDSEHIPGSIVCDLKSSDVPPVSQFDCVILGSSIYVGAIHKEAKTFLAQNSDLLCDKRLGLFLSGIDASRETEFFEANFSPEILQATTITSFLETVA